MAIEILTVLELIDESNIDAEAEEIVNKFNRTGGLVERLKTYLNFDLNAFEKENKQYKYDRCKILYFFYMLENTYFPETNILMLLSKPSMENIDNSLLGMQSYNGMIIKSIRKGIIFIYKNKD